MIIGWKSASLIDCYSRERKVVNDFYGKTDTDNLFVEGDCSNSAHKRVTKSYNIERLRYQEQCHEVQIESFLQ